MKICSFLIGSLTLLALLISGCAVATPSPTPAPTPVPTITPTPLPTPTLPPLTWQNICSQPGQRAALEGVLRLPEHVTCTVGNSPDSCTVELYDPFTGQTLPVSLPEGAGVDQMAPLPETYGYLDFKVATANGPLGQGALVSLEGTVSNGPRPAQDELPCTLVDVRGLRLLPAFDPPPGASVVPLADAVAAGNVQATINGGGLEKMTVRLQSKSDGLLEIVIAPGVIFAPQSGDVQRMVVRQAAVAVLQPGGAAALDVPVSCAEMQKKEPHPGDSFKVAAQPASSDLQKLFTLPDFAFAAPRLQQFAVWTLTDNPAKGAYTGLSLTGGFGGGPSPDELAAVKDLLAQAGLDSAKYKAFQ